MSRRVVFALAMSIAAIFAPSVADACGGYFPQTVSAGGTTEGTFVTGHRMVMSITQAQSVLWDQIDYSGNPEEFSWILPVKPGAVIELAHDAWLDVLDGATQPTVGSKTVECTVMVPVDQPNTGDDTSGGFGCRGCLSDGGGKGPPRVGDGTENRGSKGRADPVTIVSQETVGPYETVIVSTEQPGALPDWLESHGYVIPGAVVPIIDQFVAEGFDFVALRLIPGIGVRRMQPVRVVMPGPVMTLPLRLVVAGTLYHTALSLFIIGEGAYAAQNFENTTIPLSDVVWDYATNSSNYALLRRDALDGNKWLHTYAWPNSLFYPVVDDAKEDFDYVSYGGAATIAEAYWAASESPPTTCQAALLDAVDQGQTVVNPCDADGNCEPVEPGQVAVQDLLCDGDADDLVTALTGMNLSEVWLTRMDAFLDRVGLEQDLVLEAAEIQVANRMLTHRWLNSPCEGVGGNGPTPASLGGQGRRLPGGVPTVGLAILGVLLLMRRRGGILFGRMVQHSDILS